MPSALAYPGVYVEELPSGVHSIVGVGTAETAFVDFFTRGPVGEAVRVTSFSDFERRFGGLNSRSEASYALMQYFLNGGQTAWVVRVVSGGAQALAMLPDHARPTHPTLSITARAAGQGGDRIQYAIYPSAADPTKKFGLAVRQMDTTGNVISGSSELFADLSMQSGDASYAPTAVNTKPSALVTLTDLGAGTLPALTTQAHFTATSDVDNATEDFHNLAGGVEGPAAVAASYTVLGRALATVQDMARRTTLTITAQAGGQAGNLLQYAVYPSSPADVNQFSLALRQVNTAGDVVPNSIELFPNLSMQPHDAHYAPKIVNNSGQTTPQPSALVTLTDQGLGTVPARTTEVALDQTQAADKATQGFHNLEGGGAVLRVEAQSVGTWGGRLQVGIDYQNIAATDTELFNLVVREVTPGIGKPQVVHAEIYRNLSMNKASPRFAITAVNHASALVQLVALGTASVRPEATASEVTSAVQVNDATSENFKDLDGSVSDNSQPRRPASDGNVPPNGNGNLPDDSKWLEEGPNALKAGLTALETTSCNLLCLPAASVLPPAGMSTVLTAAQAFCQQQRAFLLIDVPASTILADLATADKLTSFLTTYVGQRSAYAALYFPRITLSDPLNSNKPREVGPSGTLAGLYARMDASRGVWKAPAGTEATVLGATLTTRLTDADNGALNPLGVNALRTLPVFGTVCWGARTLDGADSMASDFKYIPVRRLTSYIESSLYASTKWAVFEPNAEPLWAQLRLSIGTFMADLARQGAFYRYLVTCDATTTTASDIARGVVNIIVAFAPVKPAEFVVLKIQQLAGQSAT